MESVYCKGCGGYHQTTKVFESYWQFASERHRMYIKRLLGAPAPWTKDPIIAQHRFTNVFRASDRVSQDLLRVQYTPEYHGGTENTVLRTLLFRMFNKTETFAALEDHFGEINTGTFGKHTWRDFAEFLDDLKKRQTIYTGAYMVNPARSYGYPAKHWGTLHLLSDMMEMRVPEQVEHSNSLEQVYRLLNSFDSFGPFIAYQMAIDLNMTEVINFDENDFIVPGVGAIRGLKKCFIGLRNICHAHMIRYMVTNQEELSLRYAGSPAPSLFGRSMHLIDAQNVFCEIDKYARAAHPDVILGGKVQRIKQTYKPAGELAYPFFPPKWGINQNIEGVLGNEG